MRYWQTPLLMVLPEGQQYTSCVPDMQGLAPLMELAAQLNPVPQVGGV